jgi:hypothetical protein
VRLPRSVNIAGQVVKIESVPAGRPLWSYEEPEKGGVKACIAHGRWSLGVCEFSDNRIAISQDQSESQARDTLLHEVLHGLMRATRLVYGPIGPLANHDKEELAVALLATGLLDTLRRNPRLTAYLLEKD